MVAGIVALGYVVIGVGTASLAGAATSASARSSWRAAAWIASLLVFVAHVVYERIAMTHTAAVSARRAAFTVAAATFVLAAAGPVRSHWGAPDFDRGPLLSLALWPMLTGTASFVVAFVGAAVYGAMTRRRR